MFYKVLVLMAICFAFVGKASAAQSQGKINTSDGRHAEICHNNRNKINKRIAMRDNPESPPLCCSGYGCQSSVRPGFNASFPQEGGVAGTELIRLNRPRHSAHSRNVPFVIGTVFPKGHLFRPLIADPKQPLFFASNRIYRAHDGRYHIGAIGYGGTFGLFRWRKRILGGQVQLDFSGGVFSQFDLDTKAPELLNTDYTVGLPLVWRRGHDSARLLIYHQSSHLGPLFFSAHKPVNYALSYEGIGFLWSHRFNCVRLYEGGDYLMGTVPSSLKREKLHVGMEYYGSPFLGGLVRLVGGVDIKSWQETGWTPSVSVKFGVQYAGYNPAKRTMMVLMEAYNGYSPHGQFYGVKISYLGVGLYMGL